MDAVLPLKISGDWQEHDLRRAKMLVHSLKHFWAGEGQFRLHIVSRDCDADLISEEIQSSQNVQVDVLRESALLPYLANLHPVAGWLKQQVIKLASHNIIEDEFVLTLDADVLCIKPFRRSDFIIAGRAVTDWEPRMQHETWWQGSAKFLGKTCDMSSAGMSVTPEILSKTLLKALEQRIFRISNERTYLKLLSADHLWSEYSLYHLYAEASGALDDFHINAGFNTPQQNCLRSSNSFWSLEQFEQWKAADAFSTSSLGYFMVCQSNTRIAPEAIWDRVAAFIPGNPYS